MPRYAFIVALLTNPLNNDEFTWSNKEHEAFKRMLHTTPVLALPNYNRPFVMETNASGLGIVDILSHIHTQLPSTVF